MSENTSAEFRAIKDILRKRDISDIELENDLFGELFLLDNDADYLDRDATSEYSRIADAMGSLAADISKLPSSAMTNRHGGEFSDLIDMLVKTSTSITTEIPDLRRKRKRPITAEGAQRLRMYELLKTSWGGNTSDYAMIIAEILVATERSVTDVKRLHNTIVQQIRNHLNK